MGSLLFLQVQGVPEMPPSDFTSFLIWAIGVLVVVVATIFGLYMKAIVQIKSTNDLRIEDRDKTISEKDDIIKQLRDEKERLMNEILPALNASNSLATTLLKLLENGK